MNKIQSSIVITALLFLQQPVYAISVSENCQDNVLSPLTCGELKGNIRLYNFTNNNAYFVPDKDEDSTSIGGSLTYTSAPLYGFQIGVGVSGQHDLSEANYPVSTLTQDRFGLSEAYIKWQNDDLKITVGNQKLELPFLGEWSSFRVMPWLYQAADVSYGDKDNFIRATRVSQYKSYVTDEFVRTTRLADDKSYTEDTKGALIFGAAKKITLDEDWLKGQLWYQKYYDLTDIYYVDLHYKKHNLPWSPVFGLQLIHGEETGQAHLGKIDNLTLGAQVVLNPTRNTSWQLGYNHIKENKDAYLNGALVTPYAHIVTSTPIFAQAFLSSTQDFGAGQAVSTQLTHKFSDQFSLTTRYAHIRMRNHQGKAFNNMSEYLLFGTYYFSGALKGFSITDFFAVQTKPNTDENYIHNRIQLSYNF